MPHTNLGYAVYVTAVARLLKCNGFTGMRRGGIRSFYAGLDRAITALSAERRLLICWK